MTAELRDHVLVATEHIRARPEVVFSYLTEPALLTAWLCDTALAEGRPGGALRLDMGPVQVLGSYLVVEPPHRAGFTWDVPGWADPPPASSTVKIALPPDGSDGKDTLVVLTHRGLPTAQRNGHRHRDRKLMFSASSHSSSGMLPSRCGCAGAIDDDVESSTSFWAPETLRRVRSDERRLLRCVLVRERALVTTAAPASRKRRAMAAPMPREPTVTRTRRRANSAGSWAISLYKAILLSFVADTTT